jgi:hypothetical protein
MWRSYVRSSTPLHVGTFEIGDIVELAGCRRELRVPFGTVVRARRDVSMSGSSNLVIFEGKWGEEVKAFSQSADISVLPFELRRFDPLVTWASTGGLLSLFFLAYPMPFGGQGSSNRLSRPTEGSRNCRFNFFLKFAGHFAIRSTIECRKKFWGSLVPFSTKSRLKFPR